VGAVRLAGEPGLVLRSAISLAVALILAVPAVADAAPGAPAPSDAAPASPAARTAPATVPLTGPVVGHPAPAFTLTSTDGRTVPLDGYKGKTPLINIREISRPGSEPALKTLAWSHLCAGRIYAKGGGAGRARAEFEATRAAAMKLPPKSSRYAMYNDEAQEAIVALDLGSGSPVTAVSLAPWTGADLPGSLPGTIKYRLAVSGAPNANVDLATKGLPKGWVASFCTDRLCAPFKVSVVLPVSGVKVIEFQLIPDVAGSAEPRVTIVATDGKTSAQTSNVALR
jgi:hypothetical protein